jgi:hypothetical protein
MNPDQKEELRRLCLRFLAARSAAAFNCVSVHQTVRREMACTEEEVEEQLIFLRSSGLADEVPNRMGSRKYYQANAAGVLAFERGE